MGYAGLQFFLARDCCVVRIGDNIDDGDAIQTDHLFKVGISSSIAIDVFQGEVIVCPVRVGFENAAPFLAFSVTHGNVEEDGVGGALQDTVEMEESAEADRDCRYHCRGSRISLMGRLAASRETHEIRQVRIALELFPTLTLLSIFILGGN